MDKKFSLNGRGLACYTAIVFLISSCTNTADVPLKGGQPFSLTDSVRYMTTSIAKDLSTEGPKAWLRYFAETPGFFMASDGKLAFRDNKQAVDFINDTLVKVIRNIELKWNNMRIDSLTPVMASLGASFTEVLTDVKGQKIPVNGYFTGLVQHSTQGWQFYNLHWSIEK